MCPFRMTQRTPCALFLNAPPAPFFRLRETLSPHCNPTQTPQKLYLYFHSSVSTDMGGLPAGLEILIPSSQFYCPLGWAGNWKPPSSCTVGKVFNENSRDFRGDSQWNFTTKLLFELSFSHGYLAKLADSLLAYFSWKREKRGILSLRYLYQSVSVPKEIHSGPFCYLRSQFQYFLKPVSVCSSQFWYIVTVGYKSHCRAMLPSLDCRAWYFDSNDL